ncbi:hypothetical protein HY486_00175 [Candidatus Woesearchaeota archaeon]|nr:hypothetical protein [Candidatus Woesearchaeota archaeon]
MNNLRRVIDSATHCSYAGCRKEVKGRAYQDHTDRIYCGISCVANAHRRVDYLEITPVQVGPLEKPQE